MRLKSSNKPVKRYYKLGQISITSKREKGYYISEQSLFCQVGKPLLQRTAGDTKKGNQIEAI